MILWLFLFLLVVAISFLLAYSSMQDYQEVPAGFSSDYALFLIRRTRALTPLVLNQMHIQIIKEGLVISIERLFKGKQSALVVFGPRNILQHYTHELDLIELEDYTKINKDHTYAWEVGVKNPTQFNAENINNFFKSFPLLSEAEQLWWQLILQAKPKKNNALDFLKLDRILRKDRDTKPQLDFLLKENSSFHAQMRAVVFAADSSRRKAITEALQSLAAGQLTKVPKPYTSTQIVDFYTQRSFAKDRHNPTLTTDEVLQLSILS